MTHAQTSPLLISTPTKPRVQWVDYAKGIGILLVVIYHVWKGLFTPLRIDPQLASNVDRALEMTHMPVFFFVAGLFLMRSIQKGTRVFVIEKLRTIIWPYLIWSTVAVIALGVMAKITHSPSEIPLSSLPMRLALRPVNEFWFLYVLFFAMLLMWLLAKLRVPHWLIFLLSIGIYFVAWIPWDRFDIRIGQQNYGLAHWGALFQIARFFWLLALAVWIGPWLIRRAPGIAAHWLAFVAVIGAGLVVFAVMHHQLPFYKMTFDRVYSSFEVHINLGMWFACCAVSSVVALSILADRMPGLGLLRQMGEDSLQIYVMHVLCLAATRIVLFKLHVNNLPVHLVAGVAMGVAVPMIVAILARRFGFDWIFLLKPQKKR